MIQKLIFHYESVEFVEHKITYVLNFVSNTETLCKTTHVHPNPLRCVFTCSG